ncbi:MAG: calcium-translocating P-type ATPase, PMCA-type [Fimbriiglobus sp.]
MPDPSSLPTNQRFPGLSANEVLASRAKYGVNVLTPPEREPWWKQWLSKFEDPVIRILIIAAIIQIGVGIYKGEYIEGLAIVLAILLATTIAFVNEYKAGKEFDVLNQVNDDIPFKTIREGKFVTVSKKDLVVGDVVLIETGEEFPADAEVLEGMVLKVSESSLTGEALPVPKGPTGVELPEAGEQRAYPSHKVYRGTTVADGYGVVRLEAVGDATEFGKLGQKASEETDEETPLNEQLDKLAKWIGIIGLGIAVATFFALVGRGAMKGEIAMSGPQWTFAGILLVGLTVGLYRVWLKILLEGLGAFGFSITVPEWLDEDTLQRWLVALGLGAGVLAVALGGATAGGAIPSDPTDWMPRDAGTALLNYFMIAVVIIVVAVPEGLAMSVTLSLAYSMRKMTAQNTLVRKMHACETIGAATVICSDKTGTLTQNKMAVVEAKFPMLTSGPTPKLLIEAFAANSTAQLTHEGGQAKALGNPTEGALLLWLEEKGHNYLDARSAFKIASQLPFNTERKIMATAGSSAGSPTQLHVKGAPEVVLAACEEIQDGDHVRPLSSEDRERIRAELKDYQGRGMRTIGFGTRPLSNISTDLATQVEKLHWLGFTAIADPVRPEVPGAIKACRDAGIQVKVVTGDTSDTAREIGRQIGLIDGTEKPGSEMTGPEFAALTDEAAGLAAKDLKILSRARPLDKLRLVRLLQEDREVVAVTGDGTNDAPALNYAKVGLAMGQTGTAVAKEAADVILLDDSFRSIVTAVKWGRGLYENIQRFILFQLTINVVALGIALVGPFIGINFPLTVMQMLWVNLIMDTFAALALATEPPADHVLRRKPRSPEDFIVTKDMAQRIFGIGGVFLAILLGLLLWMPTGPGGNAETDEQKRWLTIFFTAFVLLQFWNLFNARSLFTGRSGLAGLFENKAFALIALVILLGQVALVQFGGEVFRTVPLDAQTWGILLAATSPVLIIGELVRRLK